MSNIFPPTFTSKHVLNQKHFFFLAWPNIEPGFTKLKDDKHRYPFFQERQYHSKPNKAYLQNRDDLPQAACLQLVCDL